MLKLAKYLEKSGMNLSYMKNATAADAPALQNYIPTFQEGVHNVASNLRHAALHPNQINPINMPMMTGPAGDPQQGLRGIPAMAQNLYSHMNPSGGRPTITGMNQQSNKVLGNMAEGLWNTPAVK
jgi:hypothetical protein